MREATYLILTALADGERHGYGIVQQVDAISDGRVRLGTGTLYGALERLQNDGWVRATREEVVDGRTRRYYQLTGDGRRALIDAVEQLEANARAARVRLAGA
jgi:DNA-binding PadR family transcriptional regulator